MRRKVPREEVYTPSDQWEKYDVAGNTFVVIVDEPDAPDVHKKDPKALVAEAFQRYRDVDTVLYLRKLGVNQFEYLVLEHDGSQSEMCGNGASAVTDYLYGMDIVDENLPVTLVTRSEIRIVVQSVEKGRYSVNMGTVLSADQHPESFRDFVDSRQTPEIQVEEEILNQLNALVNNPGGVDKLFSQATEFSNYPPYFNFWLKELSNDQEYLAFIKSLEYHGLYAAGGEPHTLIEMGTSQVPEKHKLEIWLKVSSFLLRAGSRYPKSMNFMFYYIDNNQQIRMYPSERGVYNGINYDHTGACGTGSVCLGTYLMKNDPRFIGLDHVGIINRSGEVLEVGLQQGNSLLIGKPRKMGAESVVDVDQSGHISTFTSCFFAERFRVACPGGEPEIDRLVEDLANSGLTIFTRVRQKLTEYFGGTVVHITTDHPNPIGFVDYYTLLSYLNAAFLAKELGLRGVHRVSLDATGTRGSDFPYSPEAVPVVQEHVSGMKKG